MIIISASCVAVFLALMSGRIYKQKDADSHAGKYAGIIREGHGPLTVFLYVAYAVILIWSLAYLIQHRGEFF